MKRITSQPLLNMLIKKSTYALYMHSRYPWKLGESQESPVTGIKPDVGAGNQSWVLCKSSWCPVLLQLLKPLS